MIANIINPLLTLEEDLISIFISNDYEFEEMNPNELHALILKNNSCYFSDSVYRYIHIISDNLKILYIKGAKGNDVCKYFDYYILQDYKVFVVFIDAITDTIDLSEPENEIQRIAKEEFGKSNLFDALAKLAEAFNLVAQDTSVYCGNTLSATALACAMRKTPYVFASAVIDTLFGLQENDISCNIPYYELLTMVRDKKIQSYLGIFN